MYCDHYYGAYMQEAGNEIYDYLNTNGIRVIIREGSITIYNLERKLSTLQPLLKDMCLELDQVEGLRTV
jgi:hypothetical protein